MTDSIPAGASPSPHSLRNRDPILAVLRRVLAPSRAVLEIGCGPGEQAPWFAAALAHLAWLPTDIDEAAVASAARWRAAAGLPNVLAPIRLDAAAPPWPLPRGFAPDAIVSINLIHIAPVGACEGLMRGAGALLPVGGTVVLYGPYLVRGRHTAPSNAAFDRSLRARNPEWGLRDTEAVIGLAASAGLAHLETVPMPANNLSLVFVKSGPRPAPGPA